MRPFIKRLAAVLPLPVVLLLAVPASAPANAQVTMNPGALDQSPPASAEPSHPARKPPPRHKPPAKPAAAKPAATPPASDAKPGAPPPPAATLPTTVPSGVSLPPIVVEPPAGKPEPPPQAPIDATAGGGVEKMANGGIRVLFSPSRTDITSETENAVRTFARKVPLTPLTSFDVTAFAPGPKEDPSTPRRLSLSRALAIRSVLMAVGVPSAQIYVRALGANAGNGPPDRVDVVAMGTNAPEAAKQ